MTHVPAEAERSIKNAVADNKHSFIAISLDYLKEI